MRISRWTKAENNFFTLLYDEIWKHAECANVIIILLVLKTECFHRLLQAEQKWTAKGTAERRVKATGGSQRGWCWPSEVETGWCWHWHAFLQNVLGQFCHKEATKAIHYKGVMSDLNDRIRHLYEANHLDSKLMSLPDVRLKKKQAGISCVVMSEKMQLKSSAGLFSITL